MEYQSDLIWAQKNRKENRKLGLRLIKNSLKDLDSIFHKAHDEAFQKIDCLKCANCCKTTSPIFRDVDIARLSKYMRMSVNDFTKRYLHMDSDNDYVLNFVPCPFLADDNSCSVYDHRPKACQEYPHTDRKKISGIMELTFKNAEVCPAVSRMFLSISEKMPAKK